MGEMAGGSKASGGEVNWMVEDGGKGDREELVKNARCAVWRVWLLGRRRGWLGVGFWLMMWRSYIRPVLEYGCEVFGQQVWVQAERVQLEAGRMILGVTKRVPNVVVRGELGMTTLRARRDIARLLYWWKMVNAANGDVVRDVYRWSRGLSGVNNWCRYTKRLLKELGLEERWEDERLGSVTEWKKLVKERVFGRENKRWREEMEEGVKTARYRVMKRDLKFEKFLLGNCMRREVANYVKMRAGVAELRVETGRWRGEERGERVCEHCDSGEIEDEGHLIARCKRWDDQREEVIEWRKKGGGEEMVNWALGGADARGSESPKNTDRVIRALAKWMRARREAGRKEEEKEVRERIQQREQKQKRKKKKTGKERRREEREKEDREEKEERAEKKKRERNGRRERAERRRKDREREREEKKKIVGVSNPIV